MTREGSGTTAHALFLANIEQNKKREFILVQLPEEISPQKVRKEFQALWKRINHKYAYTVSFDSSELVRAAIDHIHAELSVSRLQYTITYGGQQTDLDVGMVADGKSFTYGWSLTSSAEARVAIWIILCYNITECSNHRARRRRRGYEIRCYDHEYWKSGP